MPTIKDIFVIMFIAVAGFGVMLAFVTQIAYDNGGIVDNSLNTTYTRIQSYNNEFNNTLTGLAQLSHNASEAGIGDFAYFGIRGMVAIMKTPFNLVSVVYSAIGDVGGLFSAYVPIEIRTTAVLVGMTLLIFAAIKFLTSRGNEP